MTGIWVDEDNANYSSDAFGVLYNKDKTELIFCPRGFAGSYEIPSGVTAIMSSAFNGCSGLTDVTIADTVTTIDGHAFSSCTALPGITIPASVATIGYNAFAYCDRFTAITIPGTVVSIGSEVFAYCDKLETVVIEDGLVSIGNWAFENCDALTDVRLPDTLISISGRAFYSCDSLVSIIIPKKVSHIDSYAFSGCPLTEVTFEGNAPVIESNAFPKHYNIDEITAYYPADDDTWTEEIFNGSYGATFDWVPYEPSLTPEDDTLVYIVAQGSCGVNVSWKIMSDGRLVIYGTGSMQFIMRSGAAPWSAYSDQITSIVITTDVSSIADNAFADARMLPLFLWQIRLRALAMRHSQAVTVWKPLPSPAMHPQLARTVLRMSMQVSNILRTMQPGQRRFRRISAMMLLGSV